MQIKSVILTLIVLIVLLFPALTWTQAAPESDPPIFIPSTAPAGLVINEVMFYPAAGSYEWVELKNNNSSPINIETYSLTDEDDHLYSIPAGLPDVPPGAFVVILFDGQGSASDDLDFSDNVATLHSPAGLVNIFEDEFDHVALYGINRIFLPVIYKSLSDLFSTILQGLFADQSVPILSFLAWGDDPGADADHAALGPSGRSTCGRC